MATMGLPCTSLGSQGAGGAIRSTATLVTVANKAEARFLPEIGKLMLAVMQ